MKGEVIIEIDYDKFNDDNEWDGLKGYVMMDNQQAELYNIVMKKFQVSQK